MPPSAMSGPALSVMDAFWLRAISTAADFAVIKEVTTT